MPQVSPGGPAGGRPGAAGGGPADRWRAVLHGPDSELARLAQAVLAGAEAALRAGVASAAPDDPARAACAELAAELADLLRAPHSPSAPAVPVPAARSAGTSPAPAASAGGGPLAALARDFAADPQVAAHLGRTALPDATDAEIWRLLWTACLRLDPAAADRWRHAASGLAERYRGEPERWLDLPALGPEPRILVAPAPALGVPGVREVPGAAPDPEVAALAPDRPGWPWEPLAALTTQVLRLAVVDPAACHALEGLRVSGLHRLADPQTWADYRAEVHRRLAAFAATEAGSAAALRAHRLVDEAICSVVHRPPAHPRSWWARLAQHSRDLLHEHVRRARAAGLDAEMRVLEIKPYVELRGYSGGRDIPYRVDRARTGEILACLRTWLRIGPEVLSGRVIYGGE